MVLIILGPSSPRATGFLGVPRVLHIVPQFLAEYCLFITELLPYREPRLPKCLPLGCFYGIHASQTQDAAQAGQIAEIHTFSKRNAFRSTVRIW